MTANSSKEQLPTDPRYYPADRCPNFILKAKNGRYHFLQKEPDVTKNYLWYMSDTRLISVDELAAEMRVPHRRWYATDRKSFELQKKVDAVGTDGEPYVCLQSMRCPDKFFVGRRHQKPPADKVTLVVTVAELFLKSVTHQKRLVQILIHQIRRVLHNPNVFRNGTTIIEVRKHVPSHAELKLLALIPGISKIYQSAAGNRVGDPRGAVLMAGAGGIPVIPEQQVTALISGGIDSPVAAYMMMVRGCRVSGVHFLNSTVDTAAVIAKNRRIAEELSRIQGSFSMAYVDISSLQSQIVANTANQNRTLVYKWFMLSLAAEIDESKLIVTGDCVGQVASQTLNNLGTLYPTIRKAIAAPLLGLSKKDIMEVARRIETYPISIQDGADCCQYMMCKTGANLFMGRRTLERCVKRIKLSKLPVLRDLFRDGVLCESSSYDFFPTADLRGASPAASLSAVACDDGADEEVVCFDAAAGTKMPDAVKRAMLSAPEGNPNSMHTSGRAARMAVEKVRSQLAATLGVPASDIVFTSGGTESNNIALRGYKVERQAWSHASTSGGNGVADDAPVVRVVDLVNHETGSVDRDLRRPLDGRLHVDASQAFLKLDWRTLDLSEVDSITVTAHKINGPLGVGAVYLRDLACNRLYSGGSQEHGIRPGTENVPAIVAFGEAMRLDRSASVHREIESLIVDALQELGCDVNRRGETSGFIVHATLPDGFNNVDVVTKLSTQFLIEIGTGSACKTNQVNTTVYETLGKIPAPDRSIRISWDSFSTIEEAERVVTALRTVLSSSTKKQK